jgi:hypothetical protein
MCIWRGHSQSVQYWNLTLFPRCLYATLLSHRYSHQVDSNSFRLSIWLFSSPSVWCIIYHVQSMSVHILLVLLTSAYIFPSSLSVQWTAVYTNEFFLNMNIKTTKWYQTILFAMFLWIEDMSGVYTSSIKHGHKN